MGSIVKEVIELTVIALLVSAVVAGLSTVIWIWACIIYPPFDLWLAVKSVFWTVLGVGMLYGLADIAEHRG